MKVPVFRVDIIICAKFLVFEVTETDRYTRLLNQKHLCFCVLVINNRAP